MSAGRNFSDVDAVRNAVAKSLGFGVRESSPYDEADAEDGAGEVAAAEPAEPAEAAEPAPEDETAADRALQAIVERIEAEEGQATDV